MKFLNNIKNGKLKYRLNAAVLVAGVLIAAILLNVVLGTLSSKVSLKIDLTQNKIFELTPETDKLLSELSEDITIYYLVAKGEEQQYVNETLKMYQTASKKIKLENVDTVADPLFVAKYAEMGIEASMGSIIVESTNRAKLIEYADMLDIAYDEQGMQSVTGFKLEQKLTNAINYVTSGSDTAVYFTKGHGEVGYSVIKPIIEDENISTMEIDLKTSDIPGNAAALYILGPSADFSADEIKKLDEYLSDGGKLNLTLDVTNPAAPNIYKYLSEFWGVTVNDDIIVETDTDMIMSNTPIYIMPNLVSHEITDSVISGGVDILWPYSKSFNTKTTPGVAFKPIVESSDKAISRNAAAEAIDKAQPDDVEGKHTLALAITRTFPGKEESRIVLCGTTQFYATLFLEEASLANRDMLYGILRYLAKSDTSALSIAPKNVKVENLALSDGQVSAYIILFGLLPAVLVLGAGLWVWIRRRHL